MIITKPASEAGFFVEGAVTRSYQGLMRVTFTKYHALQNDFLVIERGRSALSRRRLSALVRAICHRRCGVGADGVLLVGASQRAERRVEVVNADGSRAEKSGNGLRIAALHQHLADRRRRRFLLEMDSQVHEAAVISKDASCYRLTTTLGRACFETSRIPVRCRQRYLINSPLKIGGRSFPVTCLSVGNPHTVLIVDDFDFDWQTLGAEIEKHQAFPQRTNVEFVKLISRRRLAVADWERGAGATGSSGTGAAAAVCACVIQGIAERQCRVQFDAGDLEVHWRDDGLIELTGPAAPVACGVFDYT